MARRTSLCDSFTVIFYRHTDTLTFWLLFRWLPKRFLTFGADYFIRLMDFLPDAKLQRRNTKEAQIVYYLYCINAQIGIY